MIVAALMVSLLARNPGADSAQAPDTSPGLSGDRK